MRRSQHSTLRRFVGTSAVVVAAVVVPAGIAAAAEYPDGGNPPTQVQSTGSEVKASTVWRGRCSMQARKPWRPSPGASRRSR